MVSQLEIVSKEIIKPSYPTPLHLKHLKLSFLDQLEGFCYMPFVLFYQNQWSSRNDRSQRSQQLKQSLSETLTKFYPFAGRINGNVSVDCNDSGALFVEALVHDDLSEAIQSATTTDIKQYLPLDLSQSLFNGDTSNVFQLAVQTSFFRCGGIAIGVCILHTKADAYTSAAFMNTWAAKYSGRTETVRPDFDIGLDLFPPIHIQADQVEDPSTVYDLVAGEEKIVTKRFVFDAETLARMKKIASSRSSSENPTTLEAVSAFIWKHMIDATRAKAATKRAFGLFHAIDLRRRISPPILNAMGNFAVVALAQCELEKTGDYCNLVALLRTAIRNVDGDYLKDEEKRLEYLGLLTRSKPEMGYCFFISWCKFPLYELDYGWGKPFFFCPVVKPVKNVVTLMDTRFGHGVEAWISMAEDEMAMLPPEFLALENNDFSGEKFILPSKL